MLDDLLEYESLLENELECLSIERVTWKADFGPWKAGQVCDTITFDFDAGTVQEVSAEGKTIVKGKIILSFKNE